MQLCEIALNAISNKCGFKAWNRNSVFSLFLKKIEIFAVLERRTDVYSPVRRPENTSDAKNLQNTAKKIFLAVKLIA